MCLIVGSLIDINNIITGLNDLSLRKVNSKPYGHDKVCIDKHLIEDKLYQSIDKFNERKIGHRDSYFVSLDNIHPFCDGNRVTCKILFVGNFS